MDSYEVELEPAEPDGFAAILPALRGPLVLDIAMPMRSCGASESPSWNARAAGCSRSGWRSGGRTAGSCSHSRRHCAAGSTRDCGHRPHFPHAILINSSFTNW